MKEMMVKKHVFIPKWLNKMLERAVKEGYFTSEAEAFRSGLLAVLQGIYELEPILQFYESIGLSLIESVSHLRSGNIHLALQKVEAVRTLLKGRERELAIAEPEYVRARRLLDSVLDDVTVYLHTIAMGMQGDYTIENIALDLEFLSKSYRDLARARVERISKACNIREKRR